MNGMRVISVCDRRRTTIGAVQGSTVKNTMPVRWASRNERQSLEFKDLLEPTVLTWVHDCGNAEQHMVRRQLYLIHDKTNATTGKKLARFVSYLAREVCDPLLDCFLIDTSKHGSRRVKSHKLYRSQWFPTTSVETSLALLQRCESRQGCRCRGRQRSNRGGVLSERIPDRALAHLDDKIHDTDVYE